MAADALAARFSAKTRSSGPNRRAGVDEASANAPRMRSPVRSGTHMYECRSSPRSSSRWRSSRATAIERFGRDVRHEDRLAGPHDLERSGRLVRVVGVFVEQLADERDLGGIDVGDRERTQLAIGVEQVDRAPIGDPRDGQVGQVTDRLVVAQ